jgi:hypothetical protein
MAERGVCHIYWIPRTASCEFIRSDISVLLFPSQSWSEANRADDVCLNEYEHRMR